MKEMLSMVSGRAAEEWSQKTEIAIKGSGEGTSLMVRVHINSINLRENWLECGRVASSMEEEEPFMKITLFTKEISIRTIVMAREGSSTQMEPFMREVLKLMLWKALAL